MGKQGKPRICTYVDNFELYFLHRVYADGENDDFSTVSIDNEEP